MPMNLNDPESLRRWLQVRPEQHRALLRWYWRNRPQFRVSIEEAVKP